MWTLVYGLAWRVLDAQYVRTQHFRGAVPQRRRRVFVVGYIGDWRRAAAVLFEREGLRGDPAPRRRSGQGSVRAFEAGAAGGDWCGVAPTLDARCRDGPRRNQGAVGVMEVPFPPEVCGTISDGAHNSGGLNGQDAFSGRIIPVRVNLEPGLSPSEAQAGDLLENATDLIAFQSNAGLNAGFGDEVSPTVRVASASGTAPTAVAFKVAHYTRDKDGAPSVVCPPLSADANKGDQDPVIAIQEQAGAQNPKSGPGGSALRDDGAAFTLEARTRPQAVAFGVRKRGEGAAVEVETGAL